MTEERLKQIEESFMDVEDRETLIKMAEVMGVCAYATIFEQEVDLAQDDEMLVYAHERDGFTVFA